jgi:hypothetical protein
MYVTMRATGAVPVFRRKMVLSGFGTFDRGRVPRTSAWWSPEVWAVTWMT